MGAWGTGSFANDSALDWLSEVIAGDDLEPMKAAICGPLREAAVRYDLTRPRGPLKPYTLEGTAAASWPTLDPARVIFARVPLSWQQWVESWQSAPDGKTPPRLLSSSVKLLPLGSAS